LPRAAPLLLPGFAALCCPWIYAYPIDHCVQAFKFRGERAWARVFGALLARERLAAGPHSGDPATPTLALPAPGGLPLPNLIVPVPLHRQRLRERGYNQSADIARFAARALALPLQLRALERCRATEVQSSLAAAARAANVAGAFRALGPLKGLRIALVDDVLTTGSTAHAAAAALIDAGAVGVELWVVARSVRGDPAP
jgi:ComF family protein